VTAARVALATCAELPELDEDGGLLLAALAAAGVSAEPAVWDDERVRWDAYDLVVVRSTWDYTGRREEFLAWASAVPRLANPADVLAWNTDKSYLAGLAVAGVPVVPTTFVAPGEPFEVPAYEHVVKPTVSAGARDTERFSAGEDSCSHAQALLEGGRSVMVQPYQAAVDTVGETALLWFGGVLSHAARKAAVLDGGPTREAVVTPAEASDAQVDVARQVLAAVPFPAPLLYARVDLVPDDHGAPVLLELEVPEPSLFLGRSAGAADRFAAAVARHVTGLSPAGPR
jgi:hypothetical protein